MHKNTMSDCNCQECELCRKKRNVYRGLLSLAIALNFIALILWGCQERKEAQKVKNQETQNMQKSQ
jgi:hypothetical protein